MSKIKAGVVPLGPNGEKDVSDYMLSGKEGDLRAAIAEPEQKIPAGSPLDWVNEFTLTKNEVDMFEDPEWLYKNLIVRGHFIVIPAEPNGGKTTIFLWLSEQLAKAGLRVLYVNADMGQSDAKVIFRQAEKGGFSLLAPDMKLGRSMQDIVDNIEMMNATATDLSGIVFIFDTLKKMVDVVSKKHSKKLYATLRGLTAKGATVIALAHTNKYCGDDGEPIFEGTGDLRADVDEMIYLIPRRNADKSMTVSTKPDKVRARFEPITFLIDEHRNVSRASKYHDVIAAAKADKKAEKDAPVVEAITLAMNRGAILQTEIISAVRKGGLGIGKPSITRVLRDYTGRYWRCERQFKDNAKQFFLLRGDDEKTPPYGCGKGET